METTPQSPSPVSEAAPVPTLSLGARFVAVFARPAQAWAGLERKGQWWFPLALSLVVTLAGTALTYQRALVPTIMAGMDRKVEAGQIPPEALDKFESQVSSPIAMGMNLGSVAVVVPLMMLAFALIPWVVGGFLLGRKFSFRDAFVVTCWAGLVALPSQFLTYALAWTNETMTNLHVGFGALLPAEDPPSKLMVGLGSFLDHGIGPFAIWYIVVLALGTAALSGAPRKSVLLTLGGVWLVVVAIFSVLAGVFAPGA